MTGKHQYQVVLNKDNIFNIFFLNLQSYPSEYLNHKPDTLDGMFMSLPGNNARLPLSAKGTPPPWQAAVFCGIELNCFQNESGADKILLLLMRNCCPFLIELMTASMLQMQLSKLLQ